MPSDRGVVDALNLFTPVLDGVESPGAPGDVLRSLGGNQAPVWGSPGSTITGPDIGSNSNDQATKGPAYNLYLQGRQLGALVLTAPNGMTLPAGLTLHLVMIAKGQTVLDAIVGVHVAAGVVDVVTMQGEMPALPIAFGRRLSDNRVGLVVGGVGDQWDEVQLLIARAWAEGEPSAQTWVSGWTGEFLGDLSDWSLTPAQPAGWSEVLGAGGSGVATVNLGSLSASGPVTGAAVFRMPQDLPPVAVVQLLATGLIDAAAGGAAVEVHCWLTVRRGPVPGDGVTAMDVRVLGSQAPPQLRTALDASGQPVLVVGTDTSEWLNPAISLLAAVQSGDTPRRGLTQWPGSVETSFNGWAFTSQGNIRPIFGAGGGGSGSLEDLEPGNYISGLPYDGTLPQRWDVMGSVTPQPNTLAARDASGALRSNTFIGNLQGVASAAQTLNTARRINGVPFDGSSDIVIQFSSGTGLDPLTPGNYLQGVPYTGLRPEIWSVKAAVGVQGDTLPARDLNGDVFANTFHGNLNGLAQRANALQTPRLINGVAFDGTKDININISGNFLPLSGGTLTGNLTLPSLNGGQVGGMRNHLLNSLMIFWQRGELFTFDGGGNANAGGYTADRWRLSCPGHRCEVRRVAVPLGRGLQADESPDALQVDVQTAAAAGADLVVLEQRIEGVASYAGLDVTVSFEAKSDVSGRRIAVELLQHFGSPGPSTPSADVRRIGRREVVLSDQIARYSASMSVPSLAGKTVGANFDDYLAVRIMLSGDGLQRQSGVFQITAVQIEPGTVATPLEYMPVPLMELAVQRYYQVFGGADPYELFASMVGVDPGVGDDRARGILRYAVPMRFVPAVKFSGVSTFAFDTDGSTPLTLSAAALGLKQCTLVATGQSLPPGSATLLRAAATLDARIELDAEL